MPEGEIATILLSRVEKGYYFWIIPFVFLVYVFYELSDYVSYSYIYKIKDSLRF